MNQRTIAWLLEHDNPCAEYLTRTRLLGESSQSKHATIARELIPGSPPIRKILDRQLSDGSWDDGGGWYLPKYKSSIWQLIILSQTGIDPKRPEIRRMCDNAFRFQNPEHGFSSGTVEDWSSDWARLSGCLNGNVIAALCRLGYGGDARVRKAVNRLTELQEPDGGWGCRSFGYHRNDKHSCFMGTVCALGGLVEYSKQRKVRRSADSTVEACEFILMHNLFRADHHNWKVVDPGYTKLSAPYLVEYNILRALELLAMAGVKDDRMDEALSLVRDKRKPSGRWARETRWPSNTYSSFGEISTDDKWVTMHAMITLRMLNSLKS